MELLAGIEAGGTKFVCAVGSSPWEIKARCRIPTTTPGETIDRAIAFFRSTSGSGDRLRALGIGSFGPLDLDPDSPTFGTMTTPPKAGWADVDLIHPFRHSLDVPVALDTDVNVAAFGEWRHGAARDLDMVLYLTVGTGIGGGGVIHGQRMRGLSHPEMGHIRIPHDEDRDPFPGCCPYHLDCLEGLASGPAIEQRWHASAEVLADDHPAWSLEAHYLALGISTFICVISPQRVIVGGGVMRRSTLLGKIRQEVGGPLGGYLQHPSLLGDLDTYIVPPGLGEDSGIVGALALAQATT